MTNERKGILTRLWGWLSRPSGRLSVLALLATGVVIGALGLVTFNGVLHATSSAEFCSNACHSHARFITPDFQKSAHHVNASGVAAQCSDCHIPREFLPKLWVKTTTGVRDLYAEYLVGTLSTRERYEAALPHLQKRVRLDMQARDSKECRNCHQFTPEVLGAQKPAALRTHGSPESARLTCVDCHVGVAHSVPKPQVKGVTANPPRASARGG